MKTVSKIAIFSTLLAGTLSVGAHPHSRQPQKEGPQQRRQGPSRQFEEGRQGGTPHRYAQTRHPCNNCRQRKSASQNPRGRRGEEQQQFRRQLGEDARSPDRTNNKRRQAMMKRFDTDKDGRLSAEERQAMPERKRGRPGNAPRRPTTPPVDD